MMLRRLPAGGAFGAAMLGGVLLALGCAGASASPPASIATAPQAAAEPEEFRISPEATAQADRLLEQASRVEPHLTTLLEVGAERLDVHLYGLQDRVKERDSLARKIQTQMLDSGLPADEVEISDVVRYTVLLDDHPAGDFDATAADILRRAADRGHEVMQVKNYWPAGDTYSGVNCVLRSPVGLLWELQFHTIGSLAAKDEGHHLYEELRLPTTPLDRKRELFDRLTERWSWVSVPEGVLVEHSLHEREEIILRSRP